MAKSAVEIDDVSQLVRIAYDGPALKNGSMDVHDLAPALIALGDAIDQSYRLLTGDEKGVSVRVRADFEKGSFGIAIDVVALWTKARELFSGADGTALANILQILGFVGVPTLGVVAVKTGPSLIRLVKKLHGKKPAKVIYGADPKWVTIEAEGEQFVLSIETAKLYADVRVRNALSKALAPLATDGIDRFESRDENKATIESVTREEIGDFAPPEVIEAVDNEPIVDTTSDRAFTVVAPSFRDGNKWRLSDGGGDVYGTITDADFLAKVASHEITFGTGDVLVCSTRTVQMQTPTGLRSETTVLEVKRHVPAQRQMAMHLPTPPKK